LHQNIIKERLKNRQIKRLKGLVEVNIKNICRKEHCILIHSSFKDNLNASEFITKWCNELTDGLYVGHVWKGASSMKKMKN
jgi:hypothetical protein